MSDAIGEGTDGMELKQFTDEDEDIEDDVAETSPLIAVAAPEPPSNFITREISEIFVPGKDDKYTVPQPQVLPEFELERQSDMDETDNEYLATEEQEPRFSVSHPSKTEEMEECSDVSTTGRCWFPSKSDHLQKKYNELSSAVYYHQKEKMEKILNDAEPSTLVKLLTLPDENGRPCIMQAVSRQSLNCLRPLLKKLKTLNFGSFGKKRIQALRSHSDKKNILHVAAKMVQIDEEILNAINIDLIMKDLADSKDSNGTTPLIVACQYRNHVVAQILVNARAKIDHVDRSKKDSPVSPIYLAAANGSHETLKLFLNNGARDTTNQLDLFKRRELYGNKRGNKGTILQAILESRSSETLQVCLDNGKDNIINCLREELLYSKSTKSSSQKSFIHAVCETPLVGLLELAIEENAQVLENLDEDNITPLMKATEAEQFEIVKLILSKQSGKKTLLRVKTSTKETALMMACKKGSHPIVQFIMENFASEIDLTQKDQADSNVFHHVAKHDDTLSVMIDICKRKEEYENYKDYLNLKDKDGYVPLHNAAASGAYKSVELLLENGAAYDTKSNTSRTALHYAAFSNIKTIKVLLDFVKRTTNNQVKQFIDEVDFRRQTSLHLAASFGKWQTVSVLLENGATIKCDEQNETALFLASHKGCTKTVQLLIENNPAIVNIENLAGETAAMFAAVNDQTKVLEILLDNNAKLWADSHGTGDEMGKTCLDWAVLNEKPDTVKALLERPDWREIMEKSCISPDGLLAKMVKSMPNLAIEVLNKCEKKGDKNTKYDFFALQTEGAKKCGNETHYVSAMKALEAMAENSRIDCLNHVVVRKFLDKKWSLRARKWYLGCLLIYVIFLLSFTSYISLFTENYPSDAPYMIIPREICWLFSSLSVIKELLKLFHQKSEYYSNSTCLELIMYICVFIFLPYDKKSNSQLQAGAIAIFLGWINFTWFLKRFPTYGIYIIMAKKIFFTFLKIFLPVSFFMMAFSMTFFVLLHKEVTMSTNTTTHIMTPEENEGFGNIFQSFVTSFAMMVGEVEYRDVFLQQTGKNFALIQVFLVIFLVLMSILLMNLLTGLAVGDIDVIMKRSLAEKRIQRAMLIVDLDKYLNKYCVLGLEAEYVEPLEISTGLQNSHGNFGINKGDRKSGGMSYLRKLIDKMFPSLDIEEEKSQECEITRMKEQLNVMQATLDEMNKRSLSENQVQKRELSRPRGYSYVDRGNLSGIETNV